MNVNYFQTAQTDAQNVKTLEEAEQLRQLRWQKAKELDIPEMLVCIAVHLGHDPNRVDKHGNLIAAVPHFGPMYQFKVGDVILYCDSKDCFTTVHVADKQVYACSGESEFIIPGEWLKILLGYHQAAKESEAVANEANEARALSEAMTKLI
jgi:hypothetical protein